MSNFIRTFFNRHPLITNCIAYGSLYVSSELSQQILKKKVWASPKESLDYGSLGRFAIIGTCYYSPTLYAWYKMLDQSLPGTAKRTVVKKVLLDQFTMTPILLAGFFICLSLLERKEDPFLELRHKFLPTFQCSCLFWLPATTINFIFITPRFRVIYVGVCALVWINILCWIKRQTIELVEKNEE